MGSTPLENEVTSTDPQDSVIENGGAGLGEDARATTEKIQKEWQAIQLRTTLVQTFFKEQLLSTVDGLVGVAADIEKIIAAIKKVEDYVRNGFSEPAA